MSLMTCGSVPHVVIPFTSLALNYVKFQSPQNLTQFVMVTKLHEMNSLVIYVPSPEV